MIYITIGIRDAGGADLGLANAINSDLVYGPRLFYCGHALSQTGGHGDFRQANLDAAIFQCPCSASNISRIADGISEVRKAVRDEVRKGATHIKIMASGGVASPTDRITNLQYSAEEISAIVSEAHNAGIYVMAHAYTPAAIKRCVELGVRSIEHGNLLDDDAAKSMAQHNTYLVPTLVIYDALTKLGVKNNLSAQSLKKIAQVQKSGLNAIQIAKKHKVKIGFGTDLLGEEAQAMELNEFAIRAAIETPMEIIQSATLINAEIINMHGKLGEVIKGAYVDLIAFKQNPLEDMQILMQPEKYLALIMKSGKIYKNI